MTDSSRRATSSRANLRIATRQNGVVASRPASTLSSADNELTPFTAGTIKAYAVSSSERLSTLPGVPTAKEDGIDYQMSIWAGIFAPKGTPKPIVDKLAAALDKALLPRRLRSRGGASTCRNFATISSGVYRFFGIAVPLHVKRHTSGRTTFLSAPDRSAGLFVALAPKSPISSRLPLSSSTYSPTRFLCPL